MSQHFIGAIDQGTTSTRFIIFNHHGAIVAAAQKPHAQITPQPGWVEHDPLEILRNTRETAAEALIRAGLAAADLAAIGITNQRETTVLWDRRTGQPLHNALVWQDARVERLVADYTATYGKGGFAAKTGLPLASYFSALKLQYLLDTVPGARAMAERGDALFGTIDTWLTWSLCGTHVTDVTNASRTQLMDLHTLSWCPDLLEAFRIPLLCLPHIRPSASPFGTVQAAASTELAGVPVMALLGDQQAALVGQVCFAPGEAKNTYGTGNFLLMNTGTTKVASKAGLITTLAYQFAGKPACYALEGSIAITGALVQWLRDNLGLFERSADVETLAASVPDNGGVYIVPAFSGLYAPWWREEARGLITGLTRYATKAHICRAALEAVAYQSLDVARAMEQDSGVALTSMRVDGGMVGNALLMQFQADILQARVVRPVITETTALGAAYAAGIAIGFWAGPHAVAAQWRAAHEWVPTMDPALVSATTERWHRAVARCM